MLELPLENDPISSFRGSYGFLSNFSLHGFRDEFGVYWKTAEHYYQASKAMSSEPRKRIAEAKTPGAAKRYGKQIAIRADWSVMKLVFMKKALNFKFRQNPDIAQKLIDTKNRVLIEGNSWHDNFWGCCNCSRCNSRPKRNMLGKMLMELRSVLRDELINRKENENKKET